MTEIEFCSIEQNRLIANAVCTEEAKFGLGFGIDGVLEFLPIEEFHGASGVANEYIPFCKHHKEMMEAFIENVREEARIKERIKVIQ